MKKRKWIIIVGVVIATILACVMYMDYNTLPMKLKDTAFVFEYGEDIPENADYYFTITDKDKYKEEDVQLTLPEETEVGTHQCTMKWRSQTVEFDIEIKDTKSPEITLKSEKVTIDYGSKYDAKSNVKSVKDPVDGDIEYATEGTVNVKKAGSYKVKVTATDKNSNSASKEFTVTVKEEQKESVPTTASTGKTVKSVSSSYPMTYSDGSSKITITKEWYGSKSKGAWCYIAHLQFSDYSRFKTSCGNNKYGSKETIKHAANRLNAVFAVNGCYSSPNLDYTVVRNGKIKNGGDRNLCLPAVYSQKTGILYNAWETGGDSRVAGKKVSQLVSEGLVTDTFCFGPPILTNGSVHKNSDTSRAQRTFIGTNGNAGDIWVVVSDGRKIDGVSAGLTYTQCAQLLKSKGCTFGVPLDGGGSSTMVFKGKVLNKATNRAVVDCVYFK